MIMEPRPYCIPFAKTFTDAFTSEDEVEFEESLRIPMSYICVSLLRTINTEIHSHAVSANPIIPILIVIMSQCRALPSKLYYFGSLDGTGSIKSANPHKAPSPNDKILCLDLIKDHLQDRGNGPFISLFDNLAALKRYHVTKQTGLTASTSYTLCEVESSRLGGARMYKTSENIKGMGSAAKGPLPDYLACAEIPSQAVKTLSRSILQQVKVCTIETSLCDHRR